MNFHGNPCWYELGTDDLVGAAAFYGKVLGWKVAPSGMEGHDYRLATMNGNPVAGVMPNAGQVGNPPPNWLIYFSVDDCAAAVAAIKGAGGQIYREPEAMPGIGTFAVVTDPQGAVFGLLQPDMSQMSEHDRKKAETCGAFDQKKAGHGNWNELMSSDPKAALSFYQKLFGWGLGQAMDMGAMGTYQLVRRGDADIGAIMGLGEAPASAWLPYFGVEGSVATTVETIKSAGGKVHHGPMEVPGPAYIAVGQDPQGAWFAIVGAEK